MNLMDMLSGDPPSSIYSTQENDMAAILDENATSNGHGMSTLNEEVEHPERGIYYLPTMLTRLQKELVEVLIQLFGPELLNEVRSKKSRTSIDSLLDSVSNSANSFSSYDKVTILFDQLNIINNHPSLLVDHFIPKKLLLSEINERLTSMSGKLQLFNRLVDSLVENNTNKDGFHLLVVAQSVKELELIESLVIGKRIFYENLSNAKLYDDNRRIPDFNNPKNKKLRDKVCLYLVTSSQLYNNYVPSSGKGNSKFNLIFSFDINLDTTSPSIELLRAETEETPVFIAVPVFSVEHISLQIPEPGPSFNYDKDTSNPVFKWKLQVINTLVVNRFNLFESDESNFFLDIYGGQFRKLRNSFNDSTKLKFLNKAMSDFNEKLAFHYSDEKLTKKLSTNYSSTSTSKENFQLTSFDYKSYKAKLAELLNLRLQQVLDTVEDVYTHDIAEYRIRETKRQIQYDIDEDTISTSYVKLRKLNEDAGFAEKKLGRIETDLVKTQDRKNELERRKSLLDEHLDKDENDLKNLISTQVKTLEDLKKELENVTSEYDKLNEENDSIRQKYQNSSATAVQMSSKLHKLKEQNSALEKKYDGPGMKSLPDLIRKDTLMNYSYQLQKLKTNNDFLTSFLHDKVEQLSKERQMIIDASATGSSSRPSNRISRASTPL
ncbi:structural maintenance of chromosome protein 3 [Scheffersomyces xylosifermentans]|uniref:structural maintenance of chromosome protein 3 n=1 Tax=Scheffersomyces xylosifermentans TaxID=1304137 RepID=UPI00315CC9A6